MKECNILKEKSRLFGIRITKMARFLVNNEPIAIHPMFTQVLKSGTSIGANIGEAEFGESKEDFKHKLKIALKEANETEYWIEILHKSNYLTNEQYASIIFDCKEIIKLLIASINTLNNK
jgi:four helix bundle protein